MLPNLTDYNSKVTKSLISVQKIDGENFAIATKVFSAEDGTELPSQVVGVTISEIDKEIAEAQVKVDELKAFKSDLLS